MKNAIYTMQFDKDAQIRYDSHLPLSKENTDLLAQLLGAVFVAFLKNKNVLREVEEIK